MDWGGIIGKFKFSFFDEIWDSFIEVLTFKNEKEWIKALSLFDHIFWFNNQSAFKIIWVLITFLWQPVWEPFVMYSCNSIISSFCITHLNIIKLIKTPEDIKNYNSLKTHLTHILLQNSCQIILILIKLTFNNLAIRPPHKINLLWIRFLYVKFILDQFAHFSVLIKNDNPPFIIEQETVCVLIALFSIDVVYDHSFSIQPVD